MIRSTEENNILTVKEDVGSMAIGIGFLIATFLMIAISFIFFYDFSMDFLNNLAKSRTWLQLFFFSIAISVFGLIMIISTKVHVYIFDKNNSKFVYKRKWMFFNIKIKKESKLEEIKSIRVVPYRKNTGYKRTKIISLYPVFLRINNKDLKIFGNQGRPAFRHESSKISEEETAKQIANFLKIPIKIEKLPEISKTMRTAYNLMRTAASFTKK